ncbi:hypothetical protein MMC17_000299 [Xylographa soralifera]|nr:hypothetical protein [Xylographa soralifera]
MRRSPTADQTEEEKGISKYRLINRLKHFTWAWYTLTMSTGGIALLLAEQPHTFRGLMTIGKVVFIFDLVLFILLFTAISIRFIRFPGTLSSSLHHQTESLFFPTLMLSIANIISGMQKYGVPDTGSWLLVVIRILFWTYVACAFLSAVLQYQLLFTAPKRLTIQSMTPSWILPIFPIMLSGTIASVSAGSQPPQHAMSIIIAGLTFQGLGMLVAILMYAQYVGRLMQYGLPAPDLRPGMFIAVGPPSFTALSIIGMASSIPNQFGYFGSHPTAFDILNIIAVFMAVFLWSLSFWFFSISLLSCVACMGKMRFHLSWWSFVFPNVGFTIATITIGTSLESQAITWAGTGMSIIVVGLWLFVLFTHSRAVYRREILFEGNDEDD